MELFDRPIFVVSTPRSGSSLLFEALAQAPKLYTVGGESHGLIEHIPEFSPAARKWSSNRLTAIDAAPQRLEQLAGTFYTRLKDRHGDRPQGTVRVLEKTPKNALRVPFFDAAWPDATFIYLYRDPRATLASMIEAWLSGRFRTYPRLPGWEGPPWSLLLVPDWQRLKGKSLPEIVAEQWRITTDLLVDDLGRIPAERVRTVDYSKFVASPQSTIATLARSMDLRWDRHLSSNLPFSRHTVSRPKADKWRAMEEIIESILPIVEEADAKARAFLDRLRS